MRYHICTRDSFQVTQLFTNLHTYTIYLMKRLMMVRSNGLSSLKSAKLLIVYGMKDLFTNLKRMVFQETSSDRWFQSYLSERRQLVKLRSPNDFTSKPECHNALYLDFFGFRSRPAVLSDLILVQTISKKY